MSEYIEKGCERAIIKVEEEIETKAEMLFSSVKILDCLAHTDAQQCFGNQVVEQDIVS
jgi:hypothetical protein